MMKKLVLGMVFFWCVNGETMELSSLANEVRNNPCEATVLHCFVDALVRSQDIEADCATAIDLFDGFKYSENNVNLARIHSMIYAIRRDVSCRGYALSLDYYCNGARSGEFGPYSIPSDVGY